MYNSSAPIIQTIRGPSPEACKEVLFSRYGYDYEVRETRTIIKDTFFGLRHHPETEIKFVVKEKYNPRDNARAYQQGSGMSPTRSSYASPVEQHMPTSAAPGTLADRDMNERDKLLQTLTGKVDNIKQMSALQKSIDSLKSDVLDKLNALTAESAKKEEHETIAKIDELLEQNDFTKSYIAKMNDRIRNEFSLEELDELDTVKAKVVDWIADSIAVAPKYTGRDPHVIVIVGPTGVGKTTTIAKMAAKITFVAKRKHESTPVMHMITVDNMRVGAKEQIEKYADTIEVSLDKVDTKADLEELFRIYNSSKVDYIFIDTSGFSPNDFENIAKLKSMLDIPKMHADTFLAVTASTKEHDLEKIIMTYEPFNFSSILVTKCDETMSYGNIISVLSERGKKVSMITTGQEVLHKMERATPYHFLKKLDGFDIDMESMKEKYAVADHEDEIDF